MFSSYAVIAGALNASDVFDSYTLDTCTLLGMHNASHYQGVLSKYPETETMLQSLERAGLISRHDQQLINEMLFACETIRLRKNYNVNIVQPDEFKPLANFLKDLASRNLLTAKICHALFGIITTQQKLVVLKNVLTQLEPLSEKRINFILKSPTLCLGFSELLAEFDANNKVLRYMADNVNARRIPAMQSYLTDIKKEGYFTWLTAEIFMHAVDDLCSNLTGYHHLYLVGQLCEYGCYIKSHPHFSQALQILHDAQALTAGQVLPALDNENFAAAMTSLFNMKILSSQESTDRKSGRGYFDKQRTKAITVGLLEEPALCTLLKAYSEHFNAIPHPMIVPSFEQRLSDITFLLYAKLPATYRHKVQLDTSAIEKRVREIEMSLVSICPSLGRQINANL